MAHDVVKCFGKDALNAEDGLKKTLADYAYELYETDCYKMLLCEGARSAKADKSCANTLLINYQSGRENDGLTQARQSYTAGHAIFKI